MRGFRLQLAKVALCLVAVAASGCSSGEGETKAGGTGVPVTLRIGTHDIAATAGGGQIDEFGRRVEQLSGGELRVKPVWRAAGDHIENWDQRVARLVMSGELDMGLIPSRAWDTEGVTSLRALQAPFLITSDELTAEVVSDDLATDMLSGLDAAGVVGLALLPEGLRHPFGVRGPLLGPEDYAGGSIRAATSNTTMALFAAIGASVNDAPLDSRTHIGMESSYLQQPSGTTATGNVIFYPKANALVVNEEVFADLPDEHRDVLERAAAETRDWAIRTIPDDAEAARAFCEEGGSVVLARHADVTALEDAAAQVYAELEQDPHTEELIDRIRALKSEIPASATPAPAPCDGSDQEPGGEAPGVGDGSDTGEAAAIDGVYRAELTEDELLARGLSATDAYENRGLIRLTFQNGALVTSEERGAWPDCHGVYSVSGSRLSIRMTGPGCPYEAEPTTYEWTLDGGALRITVAPREVADRFTRVWWGSEPWTRIG